METWGIAPYYFFLEDRLMTKLTDKLAKVCEKKETITEKMDKKVEEMSQKAAKTAVETAKDAIIEEVKNFWDENSNILIPLAMGVSFLLGRATSGTKNIYNVRNTYYIRR